MKSLSQLHARSQPGAVYGSADRLWLSINMMLPFDLTRAVGEFAGRTAGVTYRQGSRPDVMPTITFLDLGARDGWTIKFPAREWSPSLGRSIPKEVTGKVMSDRPCDRACDVKHVLPHARDCARPPFVASSFAFEGQISAMQCCFGALSSLLGAERAKGSKYDHPSAESFLWGTVPTSRSACKCRSHFPGV
ncbi:hypothetical protein LIA77_04741 [Sarocladium implicatum]|nr:hypothetical protein LIA77_04741 [Sarocladium implicatum]